MRLILASWLWAIVRGMTIAKRKLADVAFWLDSRRRTL